MYLFMCVVTMHAVDAWLASTCIIRYSLACVFATSYMWARENKSNVYVCML